MTALQNKVADTENRLLRAYQAIENGVAGFSDPTLKDRLVTLKADRDQAKASLDSAFASLMRENVTNGPIPFRRAYLRAVIDQVEVDDTEIRIHGRKSILERLVMGGGAAPEGMPSFVRKWRAGSDLNF
jgi:hypothetical protein